LSSGYQGRTWLFEHGGVGLVVKAVARTGLLGAVLAVTLRHEYRVYRRLQGVRGVPRCYGLFKNRYLVLEYIPGHTLRDGPLQDRDYFYARFFEAVEQMHRRGVAHMDLKRKDNILVVDGREPFFVDFGVACIRRSGFRPINAWLFKLGRRFDFNAWIKHKYRRRYEAIAAEDRKYLHRTPIEHLARHVKRAYRRIIR
jgi:serine/threonine protein kinase